MTTSALPKRGGGAGAVIPLRRLNDQTPTSVKVPSGRTRADAVTVPGRLPQRTSVTLTRLAPAARQRLLARLGELHTLERLARQPGTLAAAVVEQ